MIRYKLTWFVDDAECVFTNIIYMGYNANQKLQTNHLLGTYMRNEEISEQI